MQMKNLNNIDEKLYDKIVAVAYNDASLLDKILINRLAKKNTDVRDLLKEFKETAKAVHNIQANELSESVVGSVRKRTVNNKRKNLFGSFIYSKIAARPFFSGGIAGVIILLLSALLFFNQPQQPSKQYSKAEIELAQKQLSESMAIVNRVFKNAEQQFDKKVVPNIINKNTDKGFNLINDLLIGG